MLTTNCSQTDTDYPCCSVVVCEIHLKSGKGLELLDLCINHVKIVSQSMPGLAHQPWQLDHNMMARLTALQPEAEHVW